MQKVDLPAMANSVRGSGGTISIPAAIAAQLKLAGEVIRKDVGHGFKLVKCAEFVTAVDALNMPAPTPEPKPAKRGKGKKQAGV